MKVAGSQKILVNGWGTQTKTLDLMWEVVDLVVDLVMVYTIDWQIPSSQFQPSVGKKIARMEGRYCSYHPSIWRVGSGSSPKSQGLKGEPQELLLVMGYHQGSWLIF